MATASEVTSGSSESRAAGDTGRVTDARSRSFRVVKSSPSEVVNYESLTGVFIGSRHPSNSDLACVSYDSRFDGDSRMVVLVTFRYEPRQNSDGNDQPPGARPANWSLSAATSEAPVTSWARRQSDLPAAWGAFGEAANPLGDIYDGVTTLRPLVRITISQWVPEDPTLHAEHVGSINEEDISLKSLLIRPHQLLFSSMDATPAVESFSGVTYSGWRAEYEFLFKRNYQRVWLDPGPAPVDGVSIGWDIAVPQTGFNVRAFDPDGAGASDDIFGQPLKHGEKGTKYYGKIVPPDAGGYELPDGVAVGSKARAMVLVFSHQGGGSSQTPSAQPIPLNDNGRPRKIDDNHKPIVYAYQVYPSINITNTLGLRLF